MMNSDRTAQMLARLTQTGRSLTPGEEGRDTSNKVMHAVDVAAGLSFGGLNEEETIIVRAVFAGDHSQLKRMYELLTYRCIQISAEENWKLYANHLVKMIDLVISETLFPSRCPICNGTRFIYTAPTIPCEECGATGLVKMNDSLRANKIGASKAQYKRNLKYMYHRLFRDIQQIPQTAIDKAKAGLGKE